MWQAREHASHVARVPLGREAGDLVSAGMVSDSSNLLHVPASTVCAGDQESSHWDAVLVATEAPRGDRLNPLEEHV